MENERGLDIGGQLANSAIMFTGKTKHIIYAMPEESFAQLL